MMKFFSLRNMAIWAILAVILLGLTALLVVGPLSAHAQGPTPRLNITAVDLRYNPATAGSPNTAFVTIQTQWGHPLGEDTLLRLTLDGEPILERWYRAGGLVGIDETLSVSFHTPSDIGTHLVVAATYRASDWTGDYVPRPLIVTPASRGRTLLPLIWR